MLTVYEVGAIETPDRYFSCFGRRLEHKVAVNLFETSALHCATGCESDKREDSPNNAMYSIFLHFSSWCFM